MPALTLKPFDKMDWNAFCGAEGNNPLVCYGHTVVLDNTTYNNTAIVVDDNGLEFYLYGADYTGLGVWGYHPTHLTPSQTYTQAKFMAESLVWEQLTGDGLLALGFEIMA